MSWFNSEERARINKNLNVYLTHQGAVQIWLQYNLPHGGEIQSLSQVCTFQLFSLPQQEDECSQALNTCSLANSCCQLWSEHKPSEPRKAGDGRCSGHSSDCYTAVAFFYLPVIPFYPLSEWPEKYKNPFGKYFFLPNFSCDLPLRNMKGIIIIQPASFLCVIRDFSRGLNCGLWGANPFDISLLLVSNVMKTVSLKRNYCIFLKKVHSIKWEKWNSPPVRGRLILILILTNSHASVLGQHIRGWTIMNSF